MSMTRAYAAFAHDGIAQEPVFIRRVEDRDRTVVFRAEPKHQQVLSEATAFLMSSMLADVVDAGTAATARRLGFTRHAAGKTGTTNDFKDAWFIGFTPKLIAGVWVGFDRPRTIIGNGFASTLAVPLWVRFMKVATKHDEDVWFHPPPGVVAVKICRTSGKLPTPGCGDVTAVSDTGEVTHTSNVYTEYFARGTDPTQSCPVHGSPLYASPQYYDPAVGTTGFDDTLSSPLDAAPSGVSPATIVPPASRALPAPPSASSAPPVPPPPTSALPPPNETVPPSPPAPAPVPPDSQLDRKVDPPPPQSPQ
jgi:penicillin-binding protein 1A